jgi:aconitate hydratase
VVAYALAGSMNFDFAPTPLGTDSDGNAGVPARHLALRRRCSERSTRRSSPEMFTASYADRLRRRRPLASLPTPDGHVFEWDADSTYVRKPPYFEAMAAEPDRCATSPARGCWPSSATR